jgi:hypothetical protein
MRKVAKSMIQAFPNLQTLGSYSYSEKGQRELFLVVLLMEQ